MPYPLVFCAPVVDGTFAVSTANINKFNVGIDGLDVGDGFDCHPELLGAKRLGGTHRTI